MEKENLSAAAAAAALIKLTFRNARVYCYVALTA